MITITQTGRRVERMNTFETSMQIINMIRQNYIDSISDHPMYWSSFETIHPTKQPDKSIQVQNNWIALGCHN